MRKISFYRPSCIVSGLLIASLTLGQGLLAQPSAQDKSTRQRPDSNRQDSDRPAVTPPEEIATLLLGTQEKAVSRRDLLEERKARQRSMVVPARPKADFAPSERVAPAQKLWNKEELVEDPDMLAELWRHEQDGLEGHRLLPDDPHGAGHSSGFHPLLRQLDVHLREP